VEKVNRLRQGNAGKKGRASLKQLAYDTIAEWLISGRLQPGEPLLEYELADRLRISRTPVREALSQLAQEGLVSVVPRRGAFVAEISLREIKALFEIREGLESIAARLAATRADQAELTKIEALFEDADHEADQDKRLALFDAAGDGLHDYIIQVCGNPWIQKIIETNRTLLRKEKQISASIPGESDNSMKEHRLILEALEKRNPGLAEEHMRKHIISTLHGLLESYRK
jgi:DNA-binding GntR family transcriptional regulator